MKTKNKLADILMILIVTVFITSCKSDDDNSVAENKAPATFNLIAVADGEENVDVKPTFSWEAANDPDGDVVMYDIYLDVKNPPEILYGENLSDINFEITERLGVSNDYYWRVMAKDNKGGYTKSVIHSFSTRDLRIPNEPITPNTTFNGRQEASAIVFNDKLWIIGGYDGQRLNDIWYSEDGENWTEATSNPQFSRRTGHTSVVFDDKMWVIGGYDGAYNNEVWTSIDGENWTHHHKQL